MRLLVTVDPGIVVPPVGYGGIERIVDALVRHYRGLGHTVALLAEPGSRCPADHSFAWKRGDDGAGPGLFSGMSTLTGACNAFKPDLLHSFSRLAFMVPVLPRSLPKVMSYQRQTGGLQIGLASRMAGKSLRFTGCSRFICSMGAPHGGAWTAVHNFIEPERFTFSEQVPADAPLLFLSRVESIKGPDLALEIARASGRRLIIAGNRPKEGPELDFWNRKIAGAIGHDGVEWVGEVDDRQKNELLGKAAALVVPIQWDEPFGIVFAESLACGTPVITCSRGAAPEIIEAGRTGFFITDIASGAAAVSRLSEIDRQACRLSAETRFSARTCADQYLALYRDLIAHGPSGSRT